MSIKWIQRIIQTQQLVFLLQQLQLGLLGRTIIIQTHITRHEPPKTVGRTITTCITAATYQQLHNSSFITNFINLHNSSYSWPSPPLLSTCKTAGRTSTVKLSSREVWSRGSSDILSQTDYTNIIWNWFSGHDIYKSFMGFETQRRKNLEQIIKITSMCTIINSWSISRIWDHIKLSLDRQ